MRILSVDPGATGAGVALLHGTPAGFELLGLGAFKRQAMRGYWFEPGRGWRRASPRMVRGLRASGGAVELIQSHKGKGNPIRIETDAGAWVDYVAEACDVMPREVRRPDVCSWREQVIRVARGTSADRAEACAVAAVFPHIAPIRRKYRVDLPLLGFDEVTLGGLQDAIGSRSKPMPLLGHMAEAVCIGLHVAGYSARRS